MTDQLTTANRVETGLAAKYAERVKTLSKGQLARHHIEYDDMLRNSAHDFTSADRAEIEGVLAVIREQLESLEPLISPSQVVQVANSRSAANWPEAATHGSLVMHNHFCELVFAWNINPRRADISTVTVDEFAETIAITRLAFVNSKSMDDFIRHNGLNNFVIAVLEPHTLKNPSDFWAVRLENNHNPEAFNKFNDVYKSAMDALSEIHTERMRAIRNDGNVVHFPCAEHFYMREGYELVRIRNARIELGFGNARLST